MMKKKIGYLVILGFLFSKALYAEKPTDKNQDRSTTTTTATTTAEHQLNKLVITFQAPKGIFSTYTTISTLLGILLGTLGGWLVYCYQYGSFGKFLVRKITAKWVRGLIGTAAIILSAYMFITGITFMVAAYYFMSYQDHITCKKKYISIPVYLTIADFYIYPLQKLMSMGKRLELPYRSIVMVKEVTEKNSGYQQTILVLDSDMEIGDSPYIYLPEPFISKKKRNQLIRFLQRKGVNTHTS